MFRPARHVSVAGFEVPNDAVGSFTSGPFSPGGVPIGPYFTVGGVFFLLLGCYLLRRSRSFRRKAQSVEGVVTELRTQASGSFGADAAYPVLQFTTRDGRDVRTKARTGSLPAPAREGDHVTVLYDPDDPTTADIAGRSADILLSLSFILFGLIFTGIGLLISYFVPA